MGVTYKNKNGREFRINLNIASAKRVRQELGIDLAKIFANEFAAFIELLSDPISVCDVCYLLSNVDGMTDEDFGSQMDGDCIESASRALMEALIDFFPNPQMRGNLRTIIEKSDHATRLMTQSIEQKLHDLDASQLIGNP